MTEAASLNALPEPTTSGNSIDRWLERRSNWVACAVTLLAIQTILVVTHHPWLDEWQALQIALQSPTLSSLLENLRYEGHPPAWYLLLRAGGQFLPPNWVLPGVQLPIALAIEAVILFGLPLRRSQRLLWACNPYVLIDYGAISRSLGLGVLLFIMAVLCHGRRRASLAVALLPMVDFLFGVLSIGSLILRWRDNRLWLPGIAVWFVSCVAAAWFVRPAPDMIPALWLEGPVHDSLVELMRFGALLVPLAMANGQLVWNQSQPLIAALVGGTLFIGSGLRLLRGDWIAQAIFGAFVLLIFLFSIFVYPLAIRHVSLAAVLLVVLVASRCESRGEPGTLFTVWLAVGALCGMAVTAANLLQPFDAAPRVATFIIDHHLETKHWASFPDSRAQGVSALTGLEFERLERNCTESFIRWNYRSSIKSPSDLERELKRIADRSGRFYLLTDFDLLGVTNYSASYRQLLFVPAGVDGQQFFLYEAYPHLPEKKELLPQCPPKRLRLLPAYEGSMAGRLTARVSH